MIHYADDLVTLHHGDCLDVLRELPDASVDAVVTDPPYGLEFMGREWDGADGFRRSLNPNDAGRDNAFGRTSRTSSEYRTTSKAAAGMARTGYTDGAERLERPSHLGGLNPKCRTCQRWQRGGNPCKCEAPDFPNERLPRLHDFQVWCEAWAAECLRVLKPGGHLLAFGGTRTWHRLACAVEDAGFEVRDSIAWLYGSGFPKSLDVSKAITATQTQGGSSRRQNRMAMTGDESRSESFGSAGTEPSMLTARSTPPPVANLTDDARTWQGWGTALKPAFEPVVVARKPLGGTVYVRGIVENGLRQRGVTGDIEWTSAPANDAASPDLALSSSSTEPPPAAGTSAAPVAASETPSAAKPIGRDSATNTQPGGPPTPSGSLSIGESQPPACATPSSPHTAPTAPAVVSQNPPSSSSTTSTAEGRPTARRQAARSTSSFAARDSRPATESFAGIATGLTGSRASVRIDRLSSGTFVWPDGLPERITGGSTVAANVLAHGTGALNIDGCRVGSEARPVMVRTQTTVAASSMSGESTGATSSGEMTNAGRWPANVVLDEDAAAELDRQSGTLTSGANPTRRGSDKFRDAYGDFAGQEQCTPARGADSGGASRFFPTFRYEAKAPTAERPRAGQVAHPTVKPLDLMRWLVRLVTPPGGTVLDPFTGSGTTAEACVIEGFRCIAIEREADYLPLIVGRLSKPIQPDMFGGMA